MTKEERKAREQVEEFVAVARQNMFNARRLLPACGLSRESLHLVREIITETTRLTEISTAVI